MKKILIAVTLVLSFVVMTGCSALNVSQPSGALAVNTSSDLKADIEVGEKITGTSSMNVLFGVITFGADSSFADGVSYGTSYNPFDSTGAVKAAAAYKAVSSSGADVIVAPRYELEVKDYVVMKQVIAKVTGYKGTIKSIK